MIDILAGMSGQSDPPATGDAQEAKAAAPSGGRPPVPARRAMFGAAASTLLGVVGACAPGVTPTKIVHTPEGRVLQWEQDDLLVLVSGLRESYRPGERIELTILLNNQTRGVGIYRPRVKLIGRGQQVLVEAPVESVTVNAFDAGSAARALPLAPGFERGSYTLAVELPSWTVDGKSVSGGTLSATVNVDG
jgi:hypothetical protein